MFPARASRFFLTALLLSLVVAIGGGRNQPFETRVAASALHNPHSSPCLDTARSQGIEEHCCSTSYCAGAGMTLDSATLSCACPRSGTVDQKLQAVSSFEVGRFDRPPKPSAFLAA